MEDKIVRLRDLGAKPGDVVEWRDRKWTVMEGNCPYDTDEVWAAERVPFKLGFPWIGGYAEDCRIIYRAGEPKLWRDMTPEEKGALLLAHYEGKVIECWQFGHHFWLEVIDPNFCEDCAYRVKPEPKVEVVTGYYWPLRGWRTFTLARMEGVTHRITFNLIDGVPDCSSIKMELI